jgi:hypothetical protein
MPVLGTNLIVLETGTFRILGFTILKKYIFLEILSFLKSNCRSRYIFGRCEYSSFLVAFKGGQGPSKNWSNLGLKI